MEGPVGGDRLRGTTRRPGTDTEWDAFRAAFDRTHRALWTEFNDWVVAQGAPPLDDLEFIHTSRHANLTLYPEVAAYPRSRPLGDTWTRLEFSVRATEQPFTVPEPLRDGEGALIYLSLGSLGSADVDLMRRLVDVLGTTRHRFIVSEGHRHDEYELADTMWGAEFIPQTSVLPQVDLVRAARISLLRTTSGPSDKQTHSGNANHDRH